MPKKPLYPEKGVDAVGENTYANVIAATARECTSIMCECATNDAIVSLDGGTTEHIIVVAGADPIVLHGMSIPAGAAIQGKNETTNSNYATLRIHIW